MRLLNLNRKLKSAKRLPEIVSVFARHGFGHILSQIFERGRTRHFSSQKRVHAEGKRR